MQVNIPSPQQLGGLGRDTMKIAGTLLVAASGLSLMPPAQVASLVADLQHIKNAGTELAAALFGSGGILTIGAVYWTLAKNTIKGILNSASQVPGTTIVTTPSIAAATAPSNIVSSDSHAIEPPVTPAVAVPVKP